MYNTLTTPEGLMYNELGNASYILSLFIKLPIANLKSFGNHISILFFELINVYLL